MQQSEIAAAFQANRRAMVSFATSMVVREEIAEELVQEVAVRALQQERLPADASEMRAWLFRVVSNLAIDHLRRHATWRENLLGETRVRADADAGFIAGSHLLAGSLLFAFGKISANLRHGVVYGIAEASSVIFDIVSPMVSRRSEADPFYRDVRGDGHYNVKPPVIIPQFAHGMISDGGDKIAIFPGRHGPFPVKPGAMQGIG